MTHPVLVTHCLACKRRIHAPSKESFLKQKLNHLRNCGALKLYGQLVTLDRLPPKVVAKLAAIGPPRPFRARLLVLLFAILRALGWRR